MQTNPTTKIENNRRQSKNWIKRLPKRTWWIVLAGVVIAGGAIAYFTIHAQQASAASASQQPALQTAVARQGNLVLRASGTGTLIAAQEVNLNFKTSGVLQVLNVSVGAQVKAGDLLAQLDDSNQQVTLAQAQQALNQLTSPSAIANAQLAVTTAEANVITSQAVLNSLQNWDNTALIQDEYAKVVLAKANLDKAQTAYDSANVGPYINNPGEASLYQALYNAQQAYNTAQSIYSAYSQKPTQRQVNAAKASLALVNATLTEDQNLVAALTGGTVPADATGAGLNALNQAKIALQDAQNNLDATKLNSPISGTIMSISNHVGETVGGSTFMTIADLSKSDLQIYMDQSDWNNIQTGYTANITFDALPDQVFTGKVTQVSPQLVTIQGNSVVEGLVELDQNQAAGSVKLPLGVSASVDVIAAQANNVILVPVQALHQLAPGSYAVFVMTNGKPTLRIVTVGIQDSTFAEIKTGLKSGEVVTTGIQATTSGSQVTTP